MRLIVLIALAGLIALASLPQAGLAGAEAGAHDCLQCPEDMPAHAERDAESVPRCAESGICAVATIPAPVAGPDRIAAATFRHPRPAPRLGCATVPSLDVPPPRA